MDEHEKDTKNSEAEKGKAEETEKEEGEEPGLRQVLLPSDVHSISQFFILVLGNSAWQHLGLVPNPKTQKIEKDLEQAKIAIDIISFLFEKIRGKLGKEEESEIRNLLANLQVNFVQQSRKEEGKEEQVSEK